MVPAHQPDVRLNLPRVNAVTTLLVLTEERVRSFERCFKRRKNGMSGDEVKIGCALPLHIVANWGLRRGITYTIAFYRMSQ